ncbi:NUDIX hydrolase [Humibacillus xanthopallidus]|uniref:NUDIX hydrolase n=1 Tax=Humibacillus xanthopallidus TaxID=412689 RepID=UPI00384A4DC8
MAHDPPRALGVTSWELPGGHIDPAEAYEEAAARESLEETGVPIHVGELLAVCVHEWRERRQRKLICFFDAVAHAGIAPRLSLVEQQRRGWSDAPISYSMVHQRNPLVMSERPS